MFLNTIVIKVSSSPITLDTLEGTLLGWGNLEQLSNEDYQLLVQQNRQTRTHFETTEVKFNNKYIPNEFFYILTCLKMFERESWDPPFWAKKLVSAKRKNVGYRCRHIV